MNNIVGDSKTLWIEYELQNHEKYKIDMRLMDIEEKDTVKAFYEHSRGVFEEDKNYFKCIFEEFSNNFVIAFNISPDEDKDNITTFKVKVNLEDKFNAKLEKITFNNKIISTEIGELEVKSIKPYTTRTNIAFKFNSDIYEFMGFENPVLIDSKDNEYYQISSFSEDENGNENIGFEGEIKDGNLIFKCDGIYYARRDNRNIRVDLLNKKVEKNDYDIEVESIEDNLITLYAENTGGFNFKREDEIFNFVSQSSSKVDNKFTESWLSLELVDNSKEIIELYLESIIKDKTEALEFKLN